MKDKDLFAPSYLRIFNFGAFMLFVFALINYGLAFFSKSLYDLMTLSNYEIFLEIAPLIAIILVSVVMISSSKNVFSIVAMGLYCLLKVLSFFASYNRFHELFDQKFLLAIRITAAGYVLLFIMTLYCVVAKKTFLVVKIFSFVPGALIFAFFVWLASQQRIPRDVFINQIYISIPAFCESLGCVLCGLWFALYKKSYE